MEMMVQTKTNAPTVHVQLKCRNSLNSEQLVSSAVSWSATYIEYVSVIQYLFIKISVYMAESALPCNHQ